jgi:SAM-dependent methyltransferase
LPATGRRSDIYDPHQYWEEQHRIGTLQAVGQSGLPPELNEWLYRIGRRNVLAFMRRNGISRPLNDSVFDVGAGTGYWTELWKSMGATSVDGCDMVPVAVERLRNRFPAGDFFVADVSEQALPTDRRYGLVTVMNVLLHITPDDAFVRATKNIAGTVRSGGHLLLAEAATRHRPMARSTDRRDSSRARLVSDYVSAFEAHGLRLIAMSPSTVIGADPIDAANLLALAAWSIPWKIITIASAIGPRAAEATGRTVDRIDRVLMRTGAAPSGKLFLFRRPSTQAPLDTMVPGGHRLQRSPDNPLHVPDNPLPVLE